jgi:hypothetical protein
MQWLLVLFSFDFRNENVLRLMPFINCPRHRLVSSNGKVSDLNKGTKRVEFVYVVEGGKWTAANGTSMGSLTCVFAYVPGNFQLKISDT